MMSMESSGSNQLEGLENVFEKNMGKFDSLIKGANSDKA
jgi:hypothetical protein